MGLWEGNMPDWTSWSMYLVADMRDNLVVGGSIITSVTCISKDMSVLLSTTFPVVDYQIHSMLGTYYLRVVQVFVRLCVLLN